MKTLSESAVLEVIIVLTLLAIAIIGGMKLLAEVLEKLNPFFHAGPSV